MSKYLFLVRGLPGAGKTTLAHLITNNVFSADDFFYDLDGTYNFRPSQLRAAHESCKVRTKEAMELGISRVAVANTFTQMWEMAPYFELAEEMGYMCVVVISENHHGNESLHDVPQEAIDKMIDRFEVYL